MARALSRMEHVEFNHKEQLFGCMAHVIYLAAMDGITALGGQDYLNIEDEDSAATCVMSMHNITTQPDGFNVNLAKVLKRVHGMSVYVRASDQRRQRFAQAVEYYQQGSTVNCLILDVKTRWNSTYQMCSRFSHLRYVLVNCFFDSLVKLFFFSVQPDRDWNLPQQCRLSGICPFKRGMGKYWSAHEVSSTSEHGHQKACGFTFPHA